MVSGLKRSELKRKTPIKRTPSPKQREKNKIWKEIVIRKADDLYGICQWCNQWGSLYADFNPLGGHHIIRRSRGRIDTYENCYICHWATCHSVIGDNNIDVSVIRNKREYET